jgi:hypothetical protein
MVDSVERGALSVEGGTQWRGVHSAERGELSGEWGTQPNIPRLEEEGDGSKSSTFKSVWGE